MLRLGNRKPARLITLQFIWGIIKRRPNHVLIASICLCALLLFFLEVPNTIFLFGTCKVLKNSFIADFPKDAVTCIPPAESKPGGPSFQSHRYQKPSCIKLQKNLLEGKWVEKHYNNVEKEKQELDKLIIKFRSYHEGFSEYPFREDGVCGFAHQLGGAICRFTTVDASAWCNPRSSKPCCSDKTSGYCVAENECTAPHSINLASYVHAEVSGWVPHDKSCRMVEFSQATACALLHDKRVQSIGFVGNSLMRNMYSIMLQLLQNNYHNGSVRACMAPSLRQKCVNQWQNIDKFCLGSGLVPSSRELPGPGLCNGHLQTLLYQRGFWLANTADDLKNHVKELLDKQGTYLLVGIGVHDRYNADLITKTYLKPSFDILLGHKWPKFLWVHQLKSGIFKPPFYVRMHGTDDDIDRYVEQVDTFCEQYNIPTLDLRAVTTGVWSVDGTHYGTVYPDSKSYIDTKEVLKKTFISEMIFTSAYSAK